MTIFHLNLNDKILLASIFFILGLEQILSLPHRSIKLYSFLLTNLKHTDYIYTEQV